jgi:hypothetical protein
MMVFYVCLAIVCVAFLVVGGVALGAHLTGIAFVDGLRSIAQADQGPIPKRKKK